MHNKYIKYKRNIKNAEMSTKIEFIFKICYIKNDVR